MAKAKKTTANTTANDNIKDESKTETQTQTQTPVEPVQLTITDLQLLGQIIDLASRRGAFQAPELAQVGAAYNKLASFLAYVDATTKASEKAPGDGDAPESAE